MANIRNFFREGLNSELTQGSVFWGAYVEGYPNWENHGLIITARCDISQNKAYVYSYLPIVSFDSWLCTEFPKILYKKINKNLYTNLVSAFTSIGGSELLLKTYPLDIIITKFSNEGKNKQRENFHKKIQEYRLLDTLKNEEISITEIKKIISSFDKDTESILNDLISQNLQNYYFLDDISQSGPHIVKLRDVYHIKSQHATRLKSGIKLPNITLKNYDMSYIIGEIRSPYIEHILQKFSSLFIRIGIDDPDKSIISELVRG